MPTVNIENDALLSPRVLSFINGDQSNSNYNDQLNGNVGTSGGNFTTITMVSEAEQDSLQSPVRRINSSNTLIDRVNDGMNPLLAHSDGSPPAATTSSNYNGLYSSHSPTPNLSSTLSMQHLALGRNQAPPYSAFNSPSTNRFSNNTNGFIPYSCSGEMHSLPNSPFYTHYNHGVNGPRTPSTFMNGSGVNGRGGLYQDVQGFRNPIMPPQRELFPSSQQPQQNLNYLNNSNNNIRLANELPFPMRLKYYAIAQENGYIVGPELDRIKDNSRRSTSQSYGRISAHFRNRYGETEAKTNGPYLQLGVRVPSKDHVSEIVGKGGQKIKMIREETGALITTPGEHEEHVFIVEAPPEIAVNVAHHIAGRALEISQCKLAGERRRSSMNAVAAASSLTQSGNGNGAFVYDLGTTSNGNGILLSPDNNTSITLAPNSPLHPSTINQQLMRGGSLVYSAEFGGSGGGGGNGLVSSLPSSPCTGGGNGSLPSTTGHSVNINGGGMFLPGSALINNGPDNILLSNNSNNSNGSSMCSNGVVPVNNNNGSSLPTPTGSRILLARSRISVPQDMVGKIIGTQGSIITTIQKDTGTEIKSPPKEAGRGPNATSEFEISAYQNSSAAGAIGGNSGQAAEFRVQQAKQLICHLVIRQLERRTSDEIDETGGFLSSPGGGIPSLDDRLLLTSADQLVDSTPRSPHGNLWLWPDVAQMDSRKAREVLDRILAESKSKTRRAKEMVTTAASPSSPGGMTGAMFFNGNGRSSSLVNDSSSQFMINSPPHHNGTRLAFGGTGNGGGLDLIGGGGSSLPTLTNHQSYGMTVDHFKSPRQNCFGVSTSDGINLPSCRMLDFPSTSPFASLALTRGSWAKLNSFNNGSGDLNGEVNMSPGGCSATTSLFNNANPSAGLATINNDNNCFLDDQPSLLPLLNQPNNTWSASATSSSNMLNDGDGDLLDLDLQLDQLRLDGGDFGNGLLSSSTNHQTDPWPAAVTENGPNHHDTSYGVDQIASIWSPVVGEGSSTAATGGTNSPRPRCGAIGEERRRSEPRSPSLELQQVPNLASL